jgi:hypothetical protein
MSTVKISQLPAITQLNANTSNTLFLGVDIPTDATGKMTATVLAQGLYSNNILNVGQTHQNLPNTIAQFSLGGDSYIQTNLVNTNEGGTADIVVTANTGSGGTDSTNFIDMGYANKNYIPGTEFNNIGTAINPKDGYLYVQGTAGSNGGNLIVGTTTSNTQLRFIVGGGTAANIVARMTSNSFVLNTQSFITFADGTTQATAGSTNAYSIAAFAAANTAAANTVVIQAINLVQNTSVSAAFAQANSANVLAQSAFNKANNALANTTGVFAGGLTITGNVVTQSYIDFNSSTFDPTKALVNITASNNATVVAPSNTNYMLHITGKANTVTRVVIDSFGQNTYPLVAGRMGRGSADLPVATQNNDVMMRIVGNGYTGTQFPASSPTKIDFVAAENFSDTNRGTQIQFWNTPVGSNTLQKIATFNADTVTFTGSVYPNKGFIYTPLVYPGAQTAITIDMTNGPVVRAQTSAGLTVTLSNLTTGKVIELWVTNTAGTSQTFTHGVSALNSTTNSTTYSIPSTSTILARYMCIDGTLANTLVAVVHA